MQQDKTKKRGRFRKALAWFLGSVLAGSLIGLALVVALDISFNNTRSSHSAPKAKNVSVTENGYSGNSTQAKVAPVVLNDQLKLTAEEAQHAVVSIVAHVSMDTVFGRQEGASIGSGVVYKIEKDSIIIVTNAHVIEGAGDLYLYFDVENLAPLTIKGQDSEQDLAVLEVKKEDLPEAYKDDLATIEWGDSDKVRVGDTCMAVGCPYSLEYTDSAALGIISSTQREISYDGKTLTVMQTDAAINPGNSGGAVIDSDGRLIGIVSAKIEMNSVEGMGFFIPVNTVRPIVDQLIDQGSIDHPSLGIAKYDVISESIAEIYDVPVGLIVYSVTPGSAGDKAGLVSGDIITEIDGQTIKELADINRILDQYKVGDTVELTVIRVRGGQEPVKMQLTLVSSLAQEKASGSFFNDQQ